MTEPHFSRPSAKIRRLSLLFLSLMALACLIGPWLSPHAYDQVYRDYLFLPPSLTAHPTRAEAETGLQEIARSLRLRLTDARIEERMARVTFTSDNPIDERVLRGFARSDLFGEARLLAQGETRHEATVEAPLRRTYFFFGTDANGRDLLTRVLVAGRISLAAGLLASFVALIIGVTYGALAGYLGGLTDAFMMRALEIVYALPFIFFVIILTMIFGRGFFLILIAIGAVEWLDMARIVRAQTLSLKRRDYVIAAEAFGARVPAILWHHILPNAFGPIAAYMAVLVPRVILLESFVSFLGLGVQEPLTSWGVLIADGARTIQSAIHLLVFPALFLGLTLAALQQLGEGWRDLFEHAR